MTAVILKRFEQPDEVRVFEKGRFEIIRIGSMTIGRAIYEPGWKWSKYVGPLAGTSLCETEHVGLVISGTATAETNDGAVIELTPGIIYYIPPIPHDSQVVGDEPYISLHFLGAAEYSKGTEDRHPADVVTAMVDRVLALAETWTAWDGEPRRIYERVYTPHKAVRRVTDHLVDHLAEIEARLVGLPTIPDRWHASATTTPADLAPFTTDDLNEARNRLVRLALLYDVRLRGLSDEQLDRHDAESRSPRQIAFHVAESLYYADAVGDLRQPAAE